MAVARGEADTTVVTPSVAATSTTGDAATPDLSATTTLSRQDGPVEPGAERTPEPVPATADDAGDDGSKGAKVTQGRRRRRLRPVLIGAGVLVLLVGAYVGASYALADRVPRGTTVAGVDIGGMSAQSARSTLTDELGALATEDLTVVTHEVTGTIVPRDAGLELDVAATVDGLTGMDLRPQRLWEHIAGGGAEAPVTQADVAALDTALDGLAAALDSDPVDGQVVFTEGQPEGVPAADGWRLDQAAAKQTLLGSWLTAARPIELPSAATSPTITQEVVDATVQGVAAQVVSGPVVVQVGDQTAEIGPDVLASLSSFVPDGSSLVLNIDGKGLVDAVLARTTNLLTTATDAHFEFQDGRPVVVAGTPGTTLDPAATGAAVTAAATGTERTATVELVESDPTQTKQTLEALGVTEVVSEFSTPLTSESQRTKNISAGAAAISGTLVLPGETFSLTEALGPIDAAHGFVQAGAIVNGQHSDAWGGGLSQLSTTTFNAAFEAGMKDTDHTPHSEWFQRYPAGREATLFTGSIDMKWTNTTPYGVLVQAWTGDGKTTVRLWSTRHFDVSITSGEKTNVVNPTTVYSQAAGCTPQSAGNIGFSISVTRVVSLNGAEQWRDNLSWRYKAQNRVVCGADPATQGDGATG